MNTTTRATEEGDLAESLKALAESRDRRSKTAQVRDVIEHVEHALQAGAPRAHVLEELNRHGLGFTMEGFKSALQRICQKKREQQSG